MRTATLSIGTTAKPPAAALRPTCSVCQERPTLGALSRCAGCIRQAADVDRAQRDALRIAFEARAAQAEATEIAGKTKACRTCKRQKSLAAFHKHRLAKDGRRKVCKACLSAPQEKTPEQREADRLRQKKPQTVLGNRASVANWTARNPHAQVARHRLAYAVTTGKVAPATVCEAKGCSTRERLQGHHSNYNRPLQVNWLCPRHHRRLHTTKLRLALKATAITRFARVPETSASRRKAADQ